MAALFVEGVETAIQILWFDIHSGRAKEALAMLREAANMGDGDAFYFLGCCYMGKNYIDPAVGIDEDKTFAYECFHMSLSLESAVGMFGTMYIADYIPLQGTFVHPPYHSLMELWNAVAQKAYNGHVYCKFLLAHAYFYCKAADFFDMVPNNKLLYEWAAEAARLYRECILDGLGIALPSLITILTSGKFGAPVQQKMAAHYIAIGADMQIGFCERMIGNKHRNEGRYKEALQLYERAIAHNDSNAYYCLGKLYTFRGVLPLNLHKALQYLKKGHDLLPDHVGICNLLGEIYYRGGQNIACDYEQAFALLDKAYENGSTWGCDMLGACYLKGLGTAPDAQMAKTLLALSPHKSAL